MPFGTARDLEGVFTPPKSAPFESNIALLVAGRPFRPEGRGFKPLRNF